MYYPSVHVCDIEQSRAGRLVMEVETCVDEVRWSGAVLNPESVCVILIAEVA
jgi:hypothetical protein